MRITTFNRKWKNKHVIFDLKKTLEWGKVCVCVCAWERERERERKSEKEMTRPSITGSNWAFIIDFGLSQAPFMTFTIFQKVNACF